MGDDATPRMAKHGEPKCPVCAREPNAWCSDYHMPDARARAEQLRADADKYDQEIAAYEAAVREAK